MSLLEKWLKAVDKKNSVLCAGLDPAEFAMGRGDEGLPENASKRQWAFNYIRAVAPYCAAIKPNIQFWGGVDDVKSLWYIRGWALESGLVVIEDRKLADIGSTNDAGVFYAQQKADAVTFSPFAGNMGEVIRQAHVRDIGLITMCLMSNPEYKNEKNKLVDISGETRWEYLPEDIVHVSGVPHVKQYIQLAMGANMNNVDGIVVGAPSPKNHISEEEVKKVRRYSDIDVLVLLPGVGAQGGEAGAIWKYFGRNRVMVNVGRALMFPNGSNSTPEEQANAAKHYRDMLNELRK